MHGERPVQAFVYLARGRGGGAASPSGWASARCSATCSPASRSARSALGLVGHEGQDVMHFAEFGVVMMLFLVGLELRPGAALAAAPADPRPRRRAGARSPRPWSPRLALALGLPWQTGARGRADPRRCRRRRSCCRAWPRRGCSRRRAGRRRSRCCCSRTSRSSRSSRCSRCSRRCAAGGAARHAPTTWWPPAGWQQALLVLGAVAGDRARRALPGRGRCSALLAQTRLREMFTAAALLLVVGIALLMQTVGLSPALGTFLAGVVLAEQRVPPRARERTSSRSRACCWAVLHRGRRADRLPGSSPRSRC